MHMYEYTSFKLLARVCVWGLRPYDQGLCLQVYLALVIIRPLPVTVFKYNRTIFLGHALVLLINKVIFHYKNRIGTSSDFVAHG